MDEIELKFSVPQDLFRSVEAAIRRGQVCVKRMQAIYFDTADERLGRQGVTLRLRKEGRSWVQTVKAPTADPIRRLEHNAPVSMPRGVRWPTLDLTRHDGEPAGEALREALSEVSVGDSHPDSALAERYRTDVWRIIRLVRLRDVRAELSLDRGTITAGVRSLPVSEFELELKSGSAQALIDYAAKWAGRFGLWLSTISKAERGARLARGELEGQPLKATNPSVVPNLGALAFLVASVKSCLAQILGNASEVAAGATDEEFVHQLRVGLRRLRTALRELKASDHGADPVWEPVLRRAFQALGFHRDRAIVLPAVRVELTAAGMHFAPGTGPLSSEPTPEQTVRNADFQRTLLGVLAFTHRPVVPVGIESNGTEIATTLVVKRLRTLHHLLARDAKRFAKLDTSRQHRVRKRLKRLRYLGEFAALLFPPSQVSHYLAGWQHAQDALGDCNDHRIASEAFRAGATGGARGAGGAQAKRAVHWLADHRRTVVEQCQRDLRKASRKRPFWSPARTGKGSVSRIKLRPRPIKALVRSH